MTSNSKSLSASSFCISVIKMIELINDACCFFWGLTLFCNITETPREGSSDFIAFGSVSPVRNFELIENELEHSGGVLMKSL